MALPKIRQPLTPESTETVVPDIEIARYGLRTFNLRQGTLKSVFKNYTWEGGVCVAQCLRDDTGVTTFHEPPGENCSCGIYATTTVDSLLHQYRDSANECMTVIAAEGTTIIGDRGMRTAAARIVAYWCADQFQGLLADNCPDAERFTDPNEMFAKFGFGPPARAFPPAPLKAVDFTKIDQASWDQIKALMPAATPGGIAAIQHIIGLTS